MTKQRFDQHLHSCFSYDAQRSNTMSRVIETAIGTGLTGIAVTDHFDPLWPDEDEPSVLDIPAYEAALTRAQDGCADRPIQFAKGIELGLLPGKAADICRSVVQNYPYDFVIGSVHYSAETPIDYPPFLEARTLKDIIGEYYTILLESLKDFKDYDVVGHLNGIDRYTDGFAPESLYMPYADEILRLVVSDGKGIEVNTSSFRYGIGARGTPSMAILKRYRELGGEIVTIGSDAHKNADIGADIDRGAQWLLAAGFRHIAVFSNRKPEFYKL